MDVLRGLVGGKETMKVIDVNSKIQALAFLPGEPLRFVSGEESTVQLRHLRNDLMGEPIEPSAGALAIAASSDGIWIVTGATDGFTIWKRMSDKDVPVKMKHHAIQGVRTVDISSDSKWVVTGSDARTVDVWELSTGERRQGLQSLKHEYNVVAVRFCPCGKRLATATLFGSVRIYATGSGKKLFTIPISVMSTFASPNVTLALFANAPQIFAVSQGQIKRLKSEDGSLISQWATRGIKHPASVTLSPNSKLIAYSINATVVLRDTATGDQIGEPLKHEENVSCLAFSPGNDHLIVGANTTLAIWYLRNLTSDNSLFEHTTEQGRIEPCVNHDQDTTEKPRPTTFSLPLMNISNEAVKPWLHGFVKHAEEALTAKIGSSPPVSDYNIFANRAILRGRLEDGENALKDAELSLALQISPIGQIAKAVALIRLGNYDQAKSEIKVLDDIPDSEEHKFLSKVIQCILLCLSGDYHGQILSVIHLSEDEERQKLLYLVQSNMHLHERIFEQAIQSHRRAQVPPVFPHHETREMWSISFIFGWKFSGLEIQIQQRKCEMLLNKGSSEAADLYIEVTSRYQREITLHVELSDWSFVFKQQCLEKLEKLGDEALKGGNYGEAIKQYTAIEPLMGDGDKIYDLLLKRSEAHAKIGSDNWTKALQDAEKAIRLNSTMPWAYEKKHAVLYLNQSYREAAEALDQVIRCLTLSNDPKSVAQRDMGVKPAEARKLIVDIIEEILNQPRPQILIDTKSGRLSNKDRQSEAFRASLEYKELVLSPFSHLHDSDWQRDIRRYFRYSTLSHTWEDNGEPEYRDLEKTTVASLGSSLPNMKLQTFCKKTREHGYRWAWSDTCCINKSERDVQDVSLRSMYRWYSGSSLTIVHLRGVQRQLLDIDTDAIPEDLDDLLQEFVKCKWNTRAWTLQEYFASTVVHFYTDYWEPYLPIYTVDPDVEPTNHKNFASIKRGMKLVTGLEAYAIDALKPGSEQARQKLRLASMRTATRREDMAYSLLGIFKVTIETIYGDDEVPRALGRLLGALLTQSADVTILAWTGVVSEYNSCLPSEITVYRELESLYVPVTNEESLETSVRIMKSRLRPADVEFAQKLHDSLLDSPSPDLHYGRLKLPCISFPATLNRDPITRNYVAQFDLLDQIEINTTNDLPRSRMFLVHPWFRFLLPTDPGISLEDTAREENALKLLAALKQPFGAILLALNQSSRDYERVAADRLITARLRDDVSPQSLLANVRVLYVR
ncbi:hypothetical protein JVU11DRAFT_3762 [Chiua virens]|nr:hypothetical protein JVU11DRAFT_3762 [Chiua virens]